MIVKIRRSNSAVKLIEPLRLVCDGVVKLKQAGLRLWFNPPAGMSRPTVHAHAMFAQAALDSADVGGIESGSFGEIFLGEFAGFASFAEVQPEFGEDRITFRHDS